VYLDDLTPEEDASAKHEPDALTSELRDRIRFLEEELRRNDAILLSETASEAPDRAEYSPGPPRKGPRRAHRGLGGNSVWR
jgi:hypothetical protein